MPLLLGVGDQGCKQTAEGRWYHKYGHHPMTLEVYQQKGPSGDVAGKWTGAGGGGQASGEQHQ